MTHQEFREVANDTSIRVQEFTQLMHEAFGENWTYVEVSKDLNLGMFEFNDLLDQLKEVLSTGPIGVDYKTFAEYVESGVN